MTDVAIIGAEPYGLSLADGPQLHADRRRGRD
jgi:hypothetical protein